MLEKFNSNFANDIYAVRPPYHMAKYYRPSEMAPFHILKYNFLNHPIRG